MKKMMKALGFTAVALAEFALLAALIIVRDIPGGKRFRRYCSYSDMKALMVASGLCILLSGCIGFHWTSKVDDGAVYELNREMYVVEDDGLLLVDTRTEHPEYYTIKGKLPAGTKLQEAAKTAYRGFSFGWYFGPYSHVDVYGEVLDGGFKGRLVDFKEHRQRCPKHGYWYLCPLGCPDRNLKCLTPEKYDQKHILNSNGRKECQ